ncbi:InlB B-repeat-containing protein [Dolosicoccus paucivorans]
MEKDPNTVFTKKNFETKERIRQDLPDGYRKVIQEGREGIDRHQLMRVYHDGEAQEEVERIDSPWVDAVDEIIEIGVRCLVLKYDTNTVDTSVTAPEDNKTYAYQEQATVKGPLMRKGYQFLGWSLKQNDRTELFQAGDPLKMEGNQALYEVKNADMILYAQWQYKDPVTIPGIIAQGDSLPDPNNLVDKDQLSDGTTVTFDGDQSSVTITPLPDGTYITEREVQVKVSRPNEDPQTVPVKIQVVSPLVPVSQIPAGSDLDNFVKTNYKQVKFDKGSGQGLSGEDTYYVNPNQTVTVPTPTTKPTKGYRFEKWDKPNKGQFTDDVTTITAQYTPNPAEGGKDIITAGDDLPSAESLLTNLTDLPDGAQVVYKPG